MTLTDLKRTGWLETGYDYSTSGYLGTAITHYPQLITQMESWLPTWKKFNPVIIRKTENAVSLARYTHPFDTVISQICNTNTGDSMNQSVPTIAVVGNSPSLLEEYAGSEIDAADIVIRFNNVSNLESVKAHTGARTDIWVMSPATPINFCPADARAVIVSGLNALSRPSLYWQKLIALNLPLSEFPQEPWYELVGVFKAPPSSGTLLWASLGSLAMSVDVRSYGFTTSQINHHKFSNHFADNTPRSSRHNWPAETSWLADRLP